MFPWGTLAAGISGAAVLALLRLWLLRGSTQIAPGTSGEREPRWHVKDVNVLLLLTLVALSLRLWNLEARVIDNDEPASFGFGSLEFWAGEQDARLHPPLSPLLMSAAFGARSLLSDARSVSVVAGIATVVLVFAALRTRGRVVASLAGLFVALSPAMLHTSQLARGYALAAAFVLATHVLLTRALRHGTERAWLEYTLFGTLCLVTEYVTLAPLCAEAAVVLLSRDASRRARVGVVTSLGGMLAIASFAVPFARSTLALGVGGPTRAPDGPLLPLKHALDLFGGGGGAALGALGLLLLALAWHANPGPSSPRRASAAVISGLAMLALGGMVTAMRARYVLPVFPLLVVACAAATRAAAAARTRSSLAPHLSVGAITLCTLLFVGHAWLLPCTFRQSCAASEIARGVPLSATLGMLSAHPRAPVVVVPSWSIAEPCYRLIHKFPGPDSRRDCPARLCVENEQRAMFGLDASDFPEHFAKLQTQLGRVFVLLRGPEVAGLEACDLDAQEEGARLYRCEAREK